MEEALESCPACGQQVYGHWTRCPYCRRLRGAPDAPPSDPAPPGCGRVVLTLAIVCAAIGFAWGGVIAFRYAVDRSDWVRAEGSVTQHIHQYCTFNECNSTVVVYERNDGINVRTMLSGLHGKTGDSVGIWYHPEIPSDLLVPEQYDDLAGVPDGWRGVLIIGSTWNTLDHVAPLEVILWFAAACGMLGVAVALVRR